MQNLKNMSMLFATDTIKKIPQQKQPKYKRLELLKKLYPDSVIFIPFRDPLQHINSLLSQHIKFIEDSHKDKFVANYMGWIGHTEFGENYIPLNEEFKFKDFRNNHWLEQWCLSYQQIIDHEKS